MTPTATATPNTSPHPTPPIHLPLEIYLNVIPLLAKPELVQCCQVSQFFNSVATPKLYKELHADFGEKTSLAIPLKAIAGDGPVGTGGELMGDTPDRDVGQVLSIPNLKTRGIEKIPRPHIRQLCDALEPLDLPNLITLRVLGAGLEICALPETSPPTSPSPCPILSRVQPRRIVLGGPNYAVYNRSIIRLTEIPDFLPDSVTDLVIILGSSYDDREHYLLHRLAKSVPDTVDSLTLVIEAREAEKVAEVATTTDRPSIAAETDNPLEHHSLALFLAAAAATEGKVRAVTVVGLETRPRGPPAVDQAAESKAMKEVLIRSSTEKGSDQKAAAARAEAVRFVEMKDYDGEVR